MLANAAGVASAAATEHNDARVDEGLPGHEQDDRVREFDVCSRKKPLNVKEVADRLQIPLRTAYRLLQKDKVRALHIGGRCYIDEEAANEYLRSVVRGPRADLP